MGGNALLLKRMPVLPSICATMQLFQILCATAGMEACCPGKLGPWRAEAACLASKAGQELVERVLCLENTGRAKEGTPAVSP